MSKWHSQLDDCYRPRNVMTLRMTPDFLPQFKVLHMPRGGSQTIGWCVSAEATEFESPKHYGPLLVIVSLDDLSKNFVLSEGDFMLLIIDEEQQVYRRKEIDDCVSRAPERTIVASRKSYSYRVIQYALSLLQSALFELYAWDAAMLRVVERGGSLQDLTNIAKDLLQTHLNVSDATYSLAAYTKEYPPVGALNTALIEHGSHSADWINGARVLGLPRDWLTQGGIECFDPTEEIPCSFASGVLKIDGEYCGHVVMLCTEKELTVGLADMFALYVGHCRNLVVHYRKSSSYSPAYGSFLQKLILEQSCDPSYVEEQSKIIGIPRNSAKLLAIVDVSPSDLSGQLSYFMALLRAIAPSSLVFSVQGDVIVVSTSGDDESLASSLEGFCADHCCSAYISDRFYRLENLAFMFRQASITRTYRPIIDAQMRLLPQGKDGRIYRFTQAFNYVVLDRETDPSLRSFCLNNLIVDQIVKHDDENNSNDTAVLYWYLVLERRAAPAGDCLYMHRNSILYRIASIQKRYGLDLDDYALRQRLINCYHIKIMSSMTFRERLGSTAAE